jgi:glyoxylase-like metal-dependent hydrolase (beta-lactamase superfamily II)
MTPAGSPSASSVSEIADQGCSLGPRGRTMTTAHVIHDEGGPVPADTGWASDAPRVKQAVRELCGTVAPSAILLTHAHPDHSGAALAMTREWRCDVYLHPAEPNYRSRSRTLRRWSSTPIRWTGGSSRRKLAERGDVYVGGRVP